jgi:hypothetical protein
MGYLEKPMNQMVGILDVIMQRMEQDLRQVHQQVTKLGELIAYQTEVVENLRAENLRLQAQQNSQR